MAKKNQGQPGSESDSVPDANSEERNRHTILLKRAEQTVLKAEAAAEKIREKGKCASEAEAAEIIARYAEQAESESQQLIESAQHRREILTGEAAAVALEESGKMLSEARTESEKMLSEARLESEKMLSEARLESEEMLGEAASDRDKFLNDQTSSKEIIDRANRQARGIIDATESRVSGIESRSRLESEIIIRETTQRIAQDIRNNILEAQIKLLSEMGENARNTLGVEAGVEARPADPVHAETET